MRSTCGSLLWIGLLAFPASAQETFARLPSIDLIVRLEQGRFYSLKEACREINEKLGADYDLAVVADRRHELTSADGLALVLAAETGLMRVRIEADRFVVSVPDREDVEVRRRNRRHISRLLGIPLEAWPAEKGLHLPDPFDPAQRTVVLIHGLEAGLWGWAPSTHFISSKSSRADRFTLSDGRDFADNSCSNAPRWKVSVGAYNQPVMGA